MAPTENKIEERRKSDSMFKIILFLLGFIQAIAFAWIKKVDTQSSEVPVIVNEIGNIKVSITEMKTDLKTLVNRK